MNKSQQIKTYAFVAAMAVVAGCAQPQIATTARDVDRQQEVSDSTAQIATTLPSSTVTTASATGSSSTTAPTSTSTTTTPSTTAIESSLVEGSFADLLAGQDVSDVQADLDDGGYSAKQVRQRSTARIEIRDFLELEEVVYDECIADIDACEPRVVLPTIYDGALLEDGIETIGSMQGQGIRVTRPEPDPSMRVITNIRFKDTNHTEARAAYCSIEADILSLEVDGEQIVLAETIERQDGEILLTKTDDGWRMTGINLQDRTNGETSCS